MEDRIPKLTLISIGMMTWLIVASIILAPTSLAQTQATALEAPWIWSPRGNGASETYFRKKFTLLNPETAKLTVAAGGEFELYINGQMAVSGQSHRSATSVDVIDYLNPGVNVIAVKANHTDSAEAGFCCKLRIKEKGEIRHRVLKTDATWKSYTAPAVDWYKNGFRDLSWLSSKVIGSASSASRSSVAARSQYARTPGIEVTAKTTKPKIDLVSQAPPVPAGFYPEPKPHSASDGQTGMPPAVASKAETKPVAVSKLKTTTAETVQAKAASDGRFVTASENFSVREVLSADLTGSIIAMEFNEFGKLLLSREGGPLLIADLDAKAHDHFRLQIYCNEVTSCQGILALNGDVFVTAQGPEGQGLYRLSDVNGDGRIEVANTLLRFTGKPSEHGAHGIQLGPDGMLYIVIGNGSQLKNTPAKTSPYQFAYEGDVVPKYEDPTGQATNIKAPGGTVVRVAVDGSKVETVAGGVRNAYDLVFDENGELFIHDSDMEGDRGTTWYRPPMIFNVTAGADIGWRSGCSKFLPHYVDQLPMVCQTERGSPSGAALYQHFQFPAEYRDVLFLADWSEGKILALKKKRQGAGFVGETKEFLSGRPMNVCDLAVGEDGALYFCTGGRGTAGGVYRVDWNGEIPENVLTFNDELTKLIRHPQPNSAWARQNIAELRRAMGDSWERSILGIVNELRNPARFRVRAIHMLVWYGPKPTPQLMKTLLEDKEETVRSAAIRLCETQQTETSRKLLVGMLNDPAPFVRRRAAEGLLRFERPIDHAHLTQMLKSRDRVEALAARRLLQRIPSNQWKDDLIGSSDQRLFIQSAIALMTADPTLEHAYRVLAQASRFSEGFVNDENFIDMLRASQIALAQGNVDAAKVPALARRIGDEFPTNNPLINVELIKIMAALKVGDLDGRIEAFLSDSKVSEPEKFQAAMFLHHAGEGLNKSEQLAIVEALTRLKNGQGGGSYRGYLDLASKDAARVVGLDDIDSLVAGGERWPDAVIASFYKMPNPLTPSLATGLMELDQKLIGRQDIAAQRVRLGIIAVLARENHDDYMSYLRSCWDQEENRRADIAIGLAQEPDGENWSYLIASLPLLDDFTGRAVLTTLASVGRSPRDPFFYRTTIELGFRLRQQGSTAAVRLLEHWTGSRLDNTSQSWRGPLVQWSNWYEQTYPDAAAIVVAQPVRKGRYSTNQIAAFVENNGLGDPQSGHDLFASARCSSCHQFSGAGEGIGPDLTSLASRFSIREMIDATIDPHKSVAPRYQSKTLVTVDGQQISGLMIDEKNRPYIVMTPEGRRVTVPRDDVEDVRQSQFSHMPEGLLDEMSLSQIADLFAYIASGSRINIADRKNSGGTIIR